MSELLGLALGSNVGDRHALLIQAQQMLRERLGLQALRCSPVYETPALLPPNADASWNRPFLNQVVIAPMPHALDPYAVLAEAKAMEQLLGRQARGYWAPREIDIDILFIGNTTLVSTALTLPHIAMMQRAFVMVPLADIAPDWVHPVTAERAASVASQLATNGMVRYEH